MATPIVAGQLVKATIVTFDQDQVGLNHFFYLVSASPVPTLTDADFAFALDATVADLVYPILNNNAEYRGILAQIVDLFGRAQYVSRSSVSGAGPGTGGATALPRQSSGLTSWYTPLPRQANRGRTYWPFPSTSHDTGNGFPTSAYVSAIDALAGAVAGFSTASAGGRTANFSFVLQHRKLGNVTQILARQSRTAWATQRRRGSYGRQGTPPI